MNYLFFYVPTKIGSLNATSQVFNTLFWSMGAGEDAMLQKCKPCTGVWSTCNKSALHAVTAKRHHQRNTREAVDAIARLRACIRVSKKAFSLFFNWILKAFLRLSESSGGAHEVCRDCALARHLFQMAWQWTRPRTRREAPLNEYHKSFFLSL